jgi:valyl-tRNA synthetase
MNTEELAKTYTASDWEDALYQSWLESGYFNPDTCIEKGVTLPQAEPFSIVLPPPNVTGTLHTGHATMLAIQDTAVRFARMQGKRTLWLPGTDHAAIATQSKVEKLLHEEEGLTRYDLGRENFLARVETFAKESHDTIVHQTMKMGSSLDWSREAFTLDEKRSLSVRKAFKQMYDDGIIYRGDRIVNWDPKGQTTISDDEVIYKEETGTFYYFQYGPFVIGTARPETKFGDKYVVMHPDDTRFKEYSHGQTLEIEWINGPITTTVIKDTAIDPEFGTGVMTITPWHSTIDFEIAERHALDKEQIIDTEGILLPIAGEFAGMPITEARTHIVDKLAKKGLLVKTEDGYVHQIATAERTGATIEPQIMRQWFIGVNKEFTRDGRTVTLKSLMLEAVSGGSVTILPARFEKTYFHWIENLRDWCISRQIWYGHRIPVWYRGEEMHCDIEAPQGDGWIQDSDTLDTWFSSGLWTFSTLGWGNDEEQWKRDSLFHPVTLMETGYDIIFFWVARMILMSRYLLSCPPFKTVYLHGLVRDGEGRKMSKSLGNIVNPLDIIQNYGADALRLSLIIGSTPGNDSRLSDEKIIANRNFVNKLWNISRYVLSQSEKKSSDTPLAHTLSDQWILAKLSETITDVTVKLENYQFSLASEILRDFTLNHFADWYIEIHKVEKNDAVLRYVLEEILKLWHPFMPFVTEALWSKCQSESLLLVTKWPVALTSVDSASIEAFTQLQTLITRVRNIRATYRIAPKQVLDGVLVTENVSLFTNNQTLITALSSLNLTIATNEPQSRSGSTRITEGQFSLWLNLKDIVDFVAEQNRLIKEIAETERFAKSLSLRLNDQNFRAKAPAHIIDAQETTLRELNEKIRSLNVTLEEITETLSS